MSQPTKAPGRVMPASEEAEQHVLACCLIDGSDTISRCVETRIVTESFYWPANQILWDHILALHTKKKVVSLETLAEELTTSGSLDIVGGFPYLMQVTGKVPTTAHAGYMIEKVHEKHTLRQLIRMATGACEQAYEFTGGLDEFIEQFRQKASDIADGVASEFEQKGAMEFAVPPDDDPMTLLGNRYLNRGDGLLLVSTSGMGKSSITLQAAVCWALGRPFFGVKCNVPKGKTGLKSIIVQAEDSEGDIAEVMAGICAGMKLTKEEQAIVNANVVIIEERVERGAGFLRKLRAIVRKTKPDLVWLNPLMAFADGDITKAEVMGRFLREGLNQINAKKEFGYVIIHHTPKPPQATEKGKPTEKKWNEVMYEGAGSADLTNWARAIMVLKACETEGEFDLHLAKRGKRAGAVTEAPHGAGTRVESTTVIHLKHSTDQISGIPGRNRPLPMIFWLPRDVTVTEVPDEEEDEGDQRKSVSEADDLLQYYPAASEEPELFPSVLRLCRESRHVTSTTFESARKELLARGLITQTSDKRYHRTDTGEMVLESLCSS